MKLATGSKLLMIGDSITDVGRNRPVGEGRGEALGKGYVACVDSLLTVRYPEAGIRVVNMGSSGDRVRDLKARWQTDVLDQKPDWLSIMIGINDVWRQFDAPLRPEIHVLPEEYRATLKELVAQTRPQLQGLVLLSPYYIDRNLEDPMRRRMDEYRAIVQQTAQEFGAIYVDTQTPFDALLEHMHPMNVAWDRIHPSLTGHMFLARAFLNGIGFTW
ncbi:MAG: SGNH/GDSL hydrolase family protein [Planctomycetota bacterium]